MFLDLNGLGYCETGMLMIIEAKAIVGIVVMIVSDFTC